MVEIYKQVAVAATVAVSNLKTWNLKPETCPQSFRGET